MNQTLSSKVSDIDQMMLKFKTQVTEAKSERRKEISRLRFDIKGIQLHQQRRVGQVKIMCFAAAEQIKETLR